MDPLVFNFPQETPATLNNALNRMRANDPSVSYAIFMNQDDYDTAGIAEILKTNTHLSRISFRSEGLHDL